MKILPKSKKAIPPPIPVAEVITNFLKASNDQLTDALRQVDSWKWPRSDLNAWIKVLNKFDDIMDAIIQEYNVEKLQLKPFNLSTKELLSEILRFERLLLENSTNRKTFSSYDRLNSLLSTSDLDILILTLNLLLRPSQQYSAQPAVAHALSISTTRLQSLAKKWPHVGEYGISIVDLGTSKGTKTIANIPSEARDVNFTFYKTDPTSTEAEKPSDNNTESPNSPRKPTPTPSSNAVHVHLDEQKVLSQPVMDVLQETIQIYSVPESETFELLCRIRAAASLSEGRQMEREKLVIIRLLAIAIYGHTHSESQAMSALFLYEPDLIPHIAELLRVDQAVPVTIQTATIAALDAIARYKNKVQEVLTAVNAGVNHGVLMALVRNMVSEVTNPESQLPHAFIEALLSFITYIASHASGGNMVVGAGLIPLLIQIMENKTPGRLPVISKTMQLVDNVLYSFTNAFSLFCASRGVDALVERIEHEVDFDIKEYGGNYQSCSISGTGELPIQRVAVLKHILRSMHRMMQSSGTAEGLRGLIDMSLLKSIKKIVEYRGLFGPNIFPLAINIMSTFVHNEPTSLAIIQESGLPEIFYKAIEIAIEPAIEVIQAIPNAIGALCLNDVGQTQLAQRPSIIPAIFSIFTSDRHLKVLIDKENAVLIGTAVDELIRHHPVLKNPVFEALKSTLGAIEDLGFSHVVPADIAQWYELTPIQKRVSGDSDATMEDATSIPVDVPAGTTTESNAGNVDEEVDIDEEDESSKNHDNIVVSFIDILGRFLEGFFQHPPHCKDFITSTDGLNRLGRLTGLACLPYDFANSVASDSMVQVLRTMTEVATSESLLHLTGLVKESLDDTKFFWEEIEEPSKLLASVDLSAEEIDIANQRFRSLVTLHIRITLLSDVFATAGQAQGRAAVGLLQTLMNNTPLQVLNNLGTLHRASIWENIALNVGLTSKGIDVPSTPSPSSPLDGSPRQTPMEIIESDQSITANGSGTATGVSPTTDPLLNPNETANPVKQDSPRGWNANALKHITQGLPNALTPFFQAMVKMFHGRRNPDVNQKKQIMESSKVVANIMLQHLTLRDFDDKASLYNYYSVVLGLFMMLLVDERTSTCTLHTVELFAFYQADGFNAVLEACNLLTSKVDEVMKVREDERTELQKKELTHAFGALKVALHLIHPIVSSKPLLESGQTQLMSTRDKKTTDPNYFEAHDFLVKLRLAALPLVQSLWEAPWLIQAPLNLSRYIVRAVLEIVNGENEETKGDPNGEIVSTSSNTPRNTGPDEARIRMLTDMGFPRSAVERALARTNNNINTATEILLSQPHQFLPDPIPAAVEEPVTEIPQDTFQASAASGLEDAENPDSSAAPSDSSEVPITPDNPADEPASMTEVVGKNADEWRSTLNNAREPLRATISKQALLLIDEHRSLLFDLHMAFTKSSDHQVQAVRDLVEDVKTFSALAYEAQEQPLANRCRLLALVLCETPSVLNHELRDRLMEYLLALLLSSKDPEHPPRWLAAHLLVTEALFTLSDEPRAITLPKENEPIAAEAIAVGPLRTESRAIVFDFCLRLLAVDDLPPDDLLSVLRLFVLFTRNEEMAAQFITSGGLASLFRRIRKSAVSGGSSYIAAILRHLVEDASTIQTIMQQTIKRYFSQSRSKATDVSTYARNCSAIALRDVDIFINTTTSLCQLTQPYSSAPHISLQTDSAKDKAVEKAPTFGGEPQTDMQVDPPAVNFSSAPHKSVETVVHLLITELMTATKVVHDAPFPPTSTAIAQNQGATSTIHGDAGSSVQPGNAHQSVAPPAPRPADVQDHYQYLCFLMQCLTELLFSYDSCKVAFLSYTSKKRAQPSQGKDGNKFRTTTLHFLLSELISYGTVSPSSDTKHRNKGVLCSWAMNVVGALCVDTSSAQDIKEISSDLVSVRKFVLETVCRAIKDLPSSENTEARYGRLLALADLCHRLLTVRVNVASRKQQDDIPTHLAKIMLEKNFVAILTAALSDVDLNYPNARNLVAAILRPLEFLSKIAIKMSRTSHKNKDDTQKDASLSSESEEDEEEMGDNDRQETPDLYRNSALGMYGGEMDDRQYSEDEDMEDEDEDQDVEMDYGEETGSEDTSESGSEGEDDDLDHVTHDSGEGWGEGEEDDEGLIENPDGDEDDEDEQDADDDNEEGEGDEEDDAMMWEDIQDDADELGMALENVLDDPGHGVPIQINHEEDEPEPASDEDEFNMDNGGFPNDGIFAFSEAIVNSGLRDLGGLLVHRRHRTHDHPVFGRPRNAPAAPEATTHPLLLDISGAAHRPHSNPTRGFRHGRRIIGNGLFQTIDQVFGEGSIQVFQQMISHDGAGGETFRIQMPAGTILHHSRRFLGSSSRAERVPRIHNHRQGREFDPLLTLQRWAEEMKILHGDFVAERVGKLANHVTLALLPAAIEAMKLAKTREEEESRRKSEEEAESHRKAEEQKLADRLEGEATATESKAGSIESNAEPSIPVPAASEEFASVESARQPSPSAIVPVEQDTVMADSTPLQLDAEMEDVPEISGHTSPSANVDSSESNEDRVAESSSAPIPSAERITVMIHGSAVDITDTGIDPTFLEALPDDMREEVLNQHVRDQQASRIERPPDSQISTEFLDALPPEIRAEIIQQEAIERSRRRTEEAAPPREAEEIDPASFIASLDPTLRQAVLLEQDDGFIQSLPSHMIAEAGAYRDELTSRRTMAVRSIPRSVQPSTPGRKYPPLHDAILLLDRTGLAVLIRLLFFPQVLKKTLLFKVLVNLCENARTSTELFNILLGILQDGTGDLAAVDKSFAQMSVRNRDSKSQATKSSSRQRVTSEFLSPITSQIETVPDLIAQRCLEALNYIVSANELSSFFFLTEHDLPATLRKITTKKGKGKEKQASQTYYPIVLLLNLLDRQNLLRTPTVLESVVGLLATVTRPLTNMKSGAASSSKPLLTSTPSVLLPEDPTNVTLQVAGDSETSIAETRPSHVPEASHLVDESTTSGTNPPASNTAAVTTIPGPSDASNKNQDSNAVEEKNLLPHPPQIPHSALRLIVNILTIGECSGRTFQQSLALIQHLSHIPDARDVIAHELKVKAQEFGQTLYSDLDELAVALHDSGNNIMLTSIASKFSSASSTQAKLLRVLKTIDYMYTPKASSVDTSSNADGNTNNEDIEKVQAIYESFRFTPLWRRLGDCLTIIGERSETEHIAIVLLPLIESLMVVCKFVGSKGQGIVPRALRASASPRSPTTPRESMEDLFVTFTDAHRKILNLMVRNNPSLMSGSFSLLVNNSRVLDFDNKRNYFNQQLHRKPHIREHYGTLQLNVRRARVFEDSFLYLQRKTGDQIKNGKLSVRFYDEEGVDAGGLTREWFQILARQMFNPDYALFQPCAADKLTYQPNKNSGVNPEHLSFFKFVGRVIGKAIYDGRLLDAYFARSLYRQLLGKPVDYKDVEWVDPEYYNSLCWILENDPTLLDLTFSVEADEFGVNRIIPLKEGGESIPVTQENKREFVQLSAQYRLFSSIQDQIESLSTGFYEIIPKDLITIFNEQELELLISGTPDIDVDEWRSTTEYSGYTSSDPNIVWWWRALKSFNRDERAKVLGFATGTSRVPLSGFVDLQGVQGVQRFSIHRAYGEPDRLPQAHTCFNQIDLPQYTSYEMLRQQLLLAINEGGEGFAFS